MYALPCNQGISFGTYLGMAGEYPLFFQSDFVCDFGTLRGTYAGATENLIELSNDCKTAREAIDLLSRRLP